MENNCLLCGVGGQGTVLAAKLLAYAAGKKGLFVRTSETIGMAQRGGCVVSHVRAGDELFSPMIPKGCADVILGFEPAEAVRSLPYLKKGGAVVVNTKAISPVTASLSGGRYDGSEVIDYLREHVQNLILVDGEKICAAAGSDRVLNMALLAAAVKTGLLFIDRSELEDAVKARVNARFHSVNLRAIALVFEENTEKDQVSL